MPVDHRQIAAEEEARHNAEARAERKRRGELWHYPSFQAYQEAANAPPPETPAEPEKVWGKDRHGNPGWIDPNAPPFDLASAPIEELTTPELVLRAQAKRAGFSLVPEGAEVEPEPQLSESQQAAQDLAALVNSKAPKDVSYFKRMRELQRKAGL